ncbi:MAG: DNA cytosine methyltransferase [bacterium]|nr:DNA cytosine methyltransferase [bacterium]
MAQYLTIQEIAEKTGKSQKTVRRHIAAKKLAASRIQNKWRILPEDYKRWIESGDCDEDNDRETFAIMGSTVSMAYKDNVNWVDVEEECTKDKFNGWKHKNARNGYNFVDLFSGAGGLSCGLTMAGFTPVASVEIMPEAVETYKYNFVEQKGFKEDVETRDIRSEEVKQALYDSIGDKHIHLLVGGFPCQGFSLAGNRVVTDERNSLYLEMLKIVDHIKPEYIVMENVEGLRSMLNGRIEEKIISDYKKIGYEINVTVLNSADYGVAQTRRRVIFIGNRIGGTNYHPKPFMEEYKTLGEEIQRFMDLPEDKSINHIFSRHTEEMKKKIMAVPEGMSLYGNYSDAWKKSPWDKPSCTVKENHGGVNLHPKLPRVLTPRELAALQSFPDDFIFKGSKKWQLVQIGNAVPPLLGRAIGVAVQKALIEKEV